LSELFPLARKRSIVTEEAGPLSGTTTLRFFLHGPQRLRLTLHTESSGEAPVSATLDSLPLPPQTVPKGGGVVEFESSSEVPGPAFCALHLKAPAQVRWLALVVEPLRAGISSQSAQLARPAVEGSSLLIPFGANLDFPLPPMAATALELSVEPWVEPGVVAPQEGDWKLTLEAREDDPSTRKTGELTAGGTFSLPAFASAGMLTLCAESLSPRPPLPGQLGLKVKGTMPIPASTTPLPSGGSTPTFQGERGVTLGSLVFQSHPPALFDTAKDPERRNNLIISRPATALHLESALLARQGGAGDTGDDPALKSLRTLDYLR
jgi:hypothetical protein